MRRYTRKRSFIFMHGVLKG